MVPSTPFEAIEVSRWQFRKMMQRLARQRLVDENVTLKIRLKIYMMFYQDQVHQQG